MNVMQRDLMNERAGRAHAEANGHHQRAAARHGKSERTMRYWGTSGPPAMREFGKYVAACQQPYRAASWAMVQAKWAVVSHLTDDELIQRIRDLIPLEHETEAEDTVGEVTGLPWLERARRKERDVAINAELAACYFEAAARRIPESRVFGGDEK